MKRFVWFLILIPLIFILSCKTVWIPPRVDVSLIENIAVLPFTGSYTYAEIGRKVADAIISELSARQVNFNILDPGLVDTALRSSDISMFIVTDPTKIGQYLNVSTLLMGKVEEFVIGSPVINGPYDDKEAKKKKYEVEQESRISVTFRVIDVETGNILLADRGMITHEQSEYYYEDEEAPPLDQTPSEIERELIGEIAHKISRNFYYRKKFVLKD